MELKDMITRRRSVRKYTGVPVEDAVLKKIWAFADTVKPLYPDIGVRLDLVTKEQVRFYFLWKTPQLIAVFSENKPGYLENVGFLVQQMDLYLQSIGLGSCWLGLGKLRQTVDDAVADGKEFVILLAFGHPEGVIRRLSLQEFNRKALREIADREDPKLEPARLAPSSTNSQPWYFVHEQENIHAYCSRSGVLRHTMLGGMNRIDMGIALAHLYVANQDSFRGFCGAHPAVKGYDYICSFTIKG